MVYYLSLGANLGDREATLRRALQMIEQQIGVVLRCSSFFYSEPWGFESDHAFCNLCCALESDKTPMEVLSLTQEIERALGRKKKSTPSATHPSYSDRTIDIDLIRVFGEDGEEICMDSSELTIPHRFWTEREFVTVPLAEIMQ